MQFQALTPPSGGASTQFSASMLQIDTAVALTALSPGSSALGTVTTSSKQVWMVCLSVSATLETQAAVGQFCNTFVSVINNNTSAKYASVAMSCNPGQANSSNVVVAVPGIIVASGVDIALQWGDFSNIATSTGAVEAAAVVYYTLVT